MVGKRLAVVVLGGFALGCGGLGGGREACYGGLYAPNDPPASGVPIDAAWASMPLAPGAVVCESDAEHTDTDIVGDHRVEALSLDGPFEAQGYELAGYADGADVQLAMMWFVKDGKVVQVSTYYWDDIDITQVKYDHAELASIPGYVED
jgi:hypothetical protein